MKTVHKAGIFMKSTINYVIPQMSTDNMSLRLFLHAGNFMYLSPYVFYLQWVLSIKAKCSGKTRHSPR